MTVRQRVTIPKVVAQRAYESWDESPNRCYISTYSVASHGYAQVGWDSKALGVGGTTAHRASWTHAHGQIPVGMTVDHLPTCDRRCVNVDHLRLLSNFENARRTFGRDWPLGECINGHGNSFLRRQPAGRTRCVKCMAQYQRDYRKRKAVAA